MTFIGCKGLFPPFSLFLSHCHSVHIATISHSQHHIVMPHNTHISLPIPLLPHLLPMSCMHTRPLLLLSFSFPAWTIPAARLFIFTHVRPLQILMSYGASRIPNKRMERLRDH
jgi:hypothetical protein